MTPKCFGSRSMKKRPWEGEGVGGFGRFQRSRAERGEVEFFFQGLCFLFLLVHHLFFSPNLQLTFESSLLLGMSPENMRASMEPGSCF